MLIDLEICQIFLHLDQAYFQMIFEKQISLVYQNDWNSEFAAQKAKVFCNHLKINCQTSTHVSVYWFLHWIVLQLHSPPLQYARVRHCSMPARARNSLITSVMKCGPLSDLNWRGAPKLPKCCSKHSAVDSISSPPNVWICIRWRGYILCQEMGQLSLCLDIPWECKWMSWIQKRE